MECYLAVKKNEVTNFAGKWIEVEEITLSEVTQAPNDEHHMFSHMEAPNFKFSDMCT